MKAGHSHDRFPPTHWSVVQAAAGGADDSQAGAAWDELCRAYWFPIYAFLRRRGHDPHEA